MSVSDTDIEKTGKLPGEQRMVLHEVSWATYEHLLADLANQSSPRLAYSKGVLEIMTPLPRHERLTHTLETIIECLAAEMNIDVYCLRSTTFKRVDLERGFEPDTCFYVQHEALVRGKEIIDLLIDPPPDLVIEVDITRSSINKFPIYAQMGVPEVWRHDGNELTFYRLSMEEYEESKDSVAFPSLTGRSLSQFIRDNLALPSTAFTKAIREWIKMLGKEE